MKETKVYCDICKSDGPAITEKSIQVIFTTEQTEGRGTEPYLSMQKMDICLTCLGKMTKGKALFAHGAQGHNTYYFKEEK